MDMKPYRIGDEIHCGGMPGKPGGDPGQENEPPDESEEESDEQAPSAQQKPERLIV